MSGSHSHRNADAREEVDRMIHGDGNDPDVLPW